MTLSLVIPDTSTPCFAEDPAERAELTALFESTDILDHVEARKLCRECPFQAKCGRLALDIARGPEGWAGVPSGTWGGLLFRNGKLATRYAKRSGR